MRILVVAPDFPYPPNHGGRFDVWERLKVMKDLGHTVDLIATIKANPDRSEILCVRDAIRNLWLVRRSYSLINHLRREPFQALSRQSLAEVSLSEGYDLVWLESEYVGPILGNPTLRTSKVYLRVHNDESAYYRQLARSSRKPHERFYYLVESRKFHWYSRHLFSLSDKILFISSNERESAVQTIPGIAQKAYFLPVSLPRATFIPPSNSGKVLFLGSLFMPNNRDAISWYLKEVHPKIAHPKYELIIAGNSRGENVSWLWQACQSYKNISVYESPPNLEPLYAQAGIFVNPIRFGAGIKVKSLEAIRNGLALISTSKGVEGTGLLSERHFLLANSPSEFSQAINFLLENESFRTNMVLAAQKFIAENYDSHNLLRELLPSK